jgi:hypothetical protein
MVKEHPFTVLCDLLREPNNEVMDIFKDSVIKSRTSQKSSNPQLFELKVNKIEPISDMNEAKRRIDNLLHEISNCDNDFAVFEKASKVLTLDGIGKLMGLLLKQIPEGFLDNEKYQYLFKGMPVYKIKVVDQKWRRTRAVGRYDVFFMHSGSCRKDDVPIKFDTSGAKALYLLFLLMPRTEISNIEDFNSIIKELIMDSFDYNEDNFEEEYDKKEFKDFVKENKPIANRNIKESLQNRDDLDWYIIFLDKVKKKNQYSISIPGEMIDLSESPRLVEFKKKYLNK